MHGQVRTGTEDGTILETRVSGWRPSAPILRLLKKLRLVVLGPELVLGPTMVFQLVPICRIWIWLSNLKLLALDGN